MALCASNAKSAAASELIIEWTAPMQCPDRAYVQARVESLLGNTVTTNLTATVHVTQTPNRFGALLKVASSAGLGARTLESRDCTTLANDVALVIMISAARPVYALSETTRGDQSRELAFVLAAHATAVMGALPRLGLGLGATLALEGISALRLELSGSYYVSQSTTLQGQTTIGARFDAFRFGARACRLWAAGTFDIGGCFGAQLYRLQGEGFGTDLTSLRGDTFLWGPSLGVFGRLQLLKRLAVYLAADGVMPVTRDRFVFAVFGALHRPAVVVFQLFIAPEVQF